MYGSLSDVASLNSRCREFLAKNPGLKKKLYSYRTWRIVDAIKSEFHAIVESLDWCYERLKACERYGTMREASWVDARPSQAKTNISNQFNFDDQQELLSPLIMDGDAQNTYAISQFEPFSGFDDQFELKNTDGPNEESTRIDNLKVCTLSYQSKAVLTSAIIQLIIVGL